AINIIIKPIWFTYGPHLENLPFSASIFPSSSVILYRCFFSESITFCFSSSDILLLLLYILCLVNYFSCFLFCCIFISLCFFFNLFNNFFLFFFLYIISFTI